MIAAVVIVVTAVIAVMDATAVTEDVIVLENDNC